jgi:hypothetical protein
MSGRGVDDSIENRGVESAKAESASKVQGRCIQENTR